MTNPIKFTLDGREVEAAEGETIWQVAKREGTRIPHLCYLDKPGYRADGNCRACMVEIEGERVLAASCQRKPAEGMKVVTDSERADKSRKMVFELLAADMVAPQESPTTSPNSGNGHQPGGLKGPTALARNSKPATKTNISTFQILPLPSILTPASPAAFAFSACREVQVNDVIGMGMRGSHAAPVFDLHDPMGQSTCVYLRRMRSGLPDRRAL